MKEYDIKITETLEKTVTVRAESKEAAQEKVEQEYYNSEHILDSENFISVEFAPQAEREIQHDFSPTMSKNKKPSVLEQLKKFKKLVAAIPKKVREKRQERDL